MEDNLGFYGSTILPNLWFHFSVLLASVHESYLSSLLIDYFRSASATLLLLIQHFVFLYIESLIGTFFFFLKKNKKTRNYKYEPLNKIISCEGPSKEKKSRIGRARL